MSDIQVKFFGWCKDDAKNNDKIWGYFVIGDKVYNFWGPRGETKLVKLKFKQFTKFSNFTNNVREVEKTMREKLSKGYARMSVAVEDNVLVDIEKIYPGFTDHLKKSMFIAKLSGDIKGLQTE